MSTLQKEEQLLGRWGRWFQQRSWKGHFFAFVPRTDLWTWRSMQNGLWAKVILLWRKNKHFENLTTSSALHGFHNMSLHFSFNGIAFPAKGFYKDQHMCQVIKCFDGIACRITRELNAMDGTTCGNRSWCLRGECMYDINAPRAPGKKIFKLNEPIFQLIDSNLTTIARSMR